MCIFNAYCNRFQKCHTFQMGWNKNLSGPFFVNVIFSPVWFQFAYQFFLLDFAEINWLWVLWHAYFISYLRRLFFFWPTITLDFKLQTVLFILRIHCTDSNVINIRLNWLITLKFAFFSILLTFSMKYFSVHRLLREIQRHAEFDCDNDFSTYEMILNISADIRRLFY